MQSCFSWTNKLTKAFAFDQAEGIDVPPIVGLELHNVEVDMLDVMGNCGAANLTITNSSIVLGGTEIRQFVNFDDKKGRCN